MLKFKKLKFRRKLIKGLTKLSKVLFKIRGVPQWKQITGLI